MSYRKRHIKNKIEKIKPKTPFFAKIWFWISVLIVVFISVVVYFFVFYPGIQVKNIVISGNQKVSTEDLQKIVLENSNTGLVNLFSVRLFTKSIFLVNQKSLNDKILKQFPVIEKLVINKNLPQTILLGVVERKPAGVFCESSKCFLVDNNGVIFEEISGDPGQFFIVRQMFEQKEVFVGENVIGSNIIDALEKIQKVLTENYQINLKEAFLTSPVRLDVKTGEGWRIYFNIDSNADINLQITELNTLLKQDDLGSNRSGLKYIDLRIKDRAIICDSPNCGN